MRPRCEAVCHSRARFFAVTAVTLYLLPLSPITHTHARQSRSRIVACLNSFMLGYCAVSTQRGRCALAVPVALRTHAGIRGVPTSHCVSGH